MHEPSKISRRVAVPEPLLYIPWKALVSATILAHAYVFVMLVNLIDFNNTSSQLNFGIHIQMIYIFQYIELVQVALYI